MEPISAQTAPDNPLSQSTVELPVSTEARWNAEQILLGGKEAIIVHGQSVYRLRLTRSGKLILHK